jgi:hypothetical protein
MLSGNAQELESLNHVPVKEYRVTKDGKIEARLLDCGFEQESEWAEVSPEQLSSHVRRNTAVARWAERSLGWRRLLWACVGDLQPHPISSAKLRSDGKRHDEDAA